MSGRTRRYSFELEPEVRDWLDSLSDFKRVDEVGGLLAEKGAELGGPVAGSGNLRKAGAMTGHHTRWVPLSEQAALDSDVRLTAGHDLGSVWFETHAA